MSKAKERLDPWAEGVNELQAFLHIQRYEHALKEINGVVLDVGCGLGYGSRILYRTRNFVVAFDVSDRALSYATRNYTGPTYMRADAITLPFRDMSFDSVVAIEIIEHVNSSIHLLQEVHRVLKSKGILILSAPNIAHLRNRLECALFKKNLVEEDSKNPYHKHHYKSEELARLLESTGFTIERKWGQILTFPLVHRLPPRLCVNTGRFLPELSLHIMYKARKNVVTRAFPLS